MESIDAYSDRRGYQRVPWEYNARLMQLSAEIGECVPGMHQVIGRDISEGGLQVWADRMFAVRARLLVEMEAPDVPEGIQAVGSVAWVSHGSAGERWILGIEFSDISETARSRIRSLTDPDTVYPRWTLDHLSV